MKAPKSEGSNFEKHPPGWALVVCSRVVDIGTHFDERKQKNVRKLMIGFESEKLMQSGDYANEPFLLFANFNFSMYQNSHLCQFIENWRGKRFASQDEADNFDIDKVLGQKAFVNVAHSDDGRFVNIQTIGPVPDDRTAPDIKGKTILIDQTNLDMKEVEKLSENMKLKVLSALEQKTPAEQPSENPASGVSTENFDDDIPF